jgi:hypothetical protein
VTGFQSHVSELALQGKRIWNFVGNRFVEAHIRGIVQATGIEILEIALSFSVLQ